jgi:hypothetical protein
VAAQSQALAIGRLSASQATIKAGAAAVAKAASSQHSKQLESLVQFKAKVDEVRDSISKTAKKTRCVHMYEPHVYAEWQDAVLAGCVLCMPDRSKAVACRC